MKIPTFFFLFLFKYIPFIQSQRKEEGIRIKELLLGLKMEEVEILPGWVSFTKIIEDSCPRIFFMPLLTSKRKIWICILIPGILTS